MYGCVAVTDRCMRCTRASMASQGTAPVPRCDLAQDLRGTVHTTCVSAGMLSVAGTGLPLLPPSPAHPCRSAAACPYLFSGTQCHLSITLHVRDHSLLAAQLQMTLF